MEGEKMETLKDAPLLAAVNVHDRKELCGQDEVSRPRRETILWHQDRPQHHQRCRGWDTGKRGVGTEERIQGGGRKDRGR